MVLFFVLKTIWKALKRGKKIQVWPGSNRNQFDPSDLLVKSLLSYHFATRDLIFEELHFQFMNTYLTTCGSIYWI